MAKVAFTLPIDALRGKLGGIVFSANQAGSYVKPFRQPAYVINERIQVQRLLISTIPSAWRALTAIQRTAWNTWAALAPQGKTDSLGNTYYLNGYQQYVRIATHRYYCVASLPTAAPTLAIPAAPTILSARAFHPQDANYNCSVEFAVGSFAVGDYAYCRAAATPSQYTTTCYTGYRSILYHTQPPETPNIWSFRQPVIDHFGTLILGGQLFYRCYRLNAEFVPSMPALANATIIPKP